LTWSQPRDPRIAHSPRSTATPAEARPQSASQLATGIWQQATGNRGSTVLITPGMPHAPHSPTTPAQASLQSTNSLATAKGQLAGARAPSLLKRHTHPTHPQTPAQANLQFANPPAMAPGNWQPAVARAPSVPGWHTRPNHPQLQHKPKSNSRIHSQLATGNFANGRGPRPHHSTDLTLHGSIATPAQANLQFASPPAARNWQLAMARPRHTSNATLAQLTHNPSTSQPPVRESTGDWQLATGRVSSLVTRRIPQSPQSPTTPAQANLQFANPAATGIWQLPMASAASLLEWHAHPTHPQLQHKPTSSSRIHWQLETGNWPWLRPHHSRTGALTPPTRLRHEPTPSSRIAWQSATGNWPSHAHRHHSNGTPTPLTRSSGTGRSAVRECTADWPPATGRGSRPTTPRITHSPNSRATPARGHLQSAIPPRAGRWPSPRPVPPRRVHPLTHPRLRHQPGSGSGVLRQLATDRRRWLAPHHSSNGTLTPLTVSSGSRRSPVRRFTCNW
jgi:hypothetical protein